MKLGALLQSSKSLIYSVILEILDTTLCDKVCQLPVTGWWFSSVSFTNRTNRHNIAEILLKFALNTINLILTLIWKLAQDYKYQHKKKNDILNSHNIH